MEKLKSFNRDTAWLVLLIMLAIAAAAVAVMGFKKRLQSEVAVFQNKSEIRYGLPRLAKDLDLDDMQTVEDYEILAKIHASLISLDQAGRIYPGVAKNWKVLEGGRQILFHLRPHLEFASGKAFRCGDVLETFEHLRDIKDDSLWAIKMVKAMECKSDFQLLVTLERPSPFFLSELADVRYSIRPGDSFHEGKGPDLDGLGAYRIVSFDPGDDHIQIVRRENTPFATVQSPLKVRYEKFEDVDEAARHLKDGSLDLYPLRGKLVDSAKFLVSSRHVHRVWLLVLSKNLMKTYPQLTQCLNSMMKRDNILASIKDPAFFKTSTVVLLDDDGGSTNRLLLGAFNSEEDDNCIKSVPHQIRMMTMRNQDPRIIESVSHELRRLSIQTKSLLSYSKEDFISKLSSDVYDVALFSFGSTPSAVSDLAYFFINNRSFPPSAWVDNSLAKMAQKITLSRNEVEGHERLLNVLGQSLRKSPLVALFFEKERYLTGKCLKILDPDRFLLGQHFGSITREGACH